MSYERSTEWINNYFGLVLIIIFLVVQYVIILVHCIGRKLLSLVRKNERGSFISNQVQFVRNHMIIFRLSNAITMFIDLCVNEVFFDALSFHPFVNFAITWVVGYLTDKLADKYVDKKYKQDNYLKNTVAAAADTVWKCWMAVVPFTVIAICKITLIMVVMLTI
ncbi:hypothetical protein I4U23_004821 [Adineta vaga]|nr:hypothetical protein I4U23_004821 [Adineta vaga]